MRQKPPGASAAYNIDDRVKDGATADCLRSSSAAKASGMLSKNLPLFVGEVREIFRSFRFGTSGTIFFVPWCEIEGIRTVFY